MVMKKAKVQPHQHLSMDTEPKQLRMYMVPCSCGVSFAVAPDYHRRGTTWSRYLACPNCGKRHDPKNRLLELGYSGNGYWAVDKC
jgi:hypothetical protein